MEENIYSRNYITATGVKWSFYYDFNTDAGILKDSANEYKFSLDGGIITFDDQTTEEKISILSDNEIKWFENCTSEAIFTKKEK